MEQLPIFIQNYMNHLKQLGRKDSTVKRYQYDLFDFQKWIINSRQTNKPIDWKSITTEELESFFDELVSVRQYRVRTIRRIHSVLRQIAQYQHSIGSSELQLIENIESPILQMDSLNDSDWLSSKELITLTHSVSSTTSLSEQQIEMFPFYKQRNALIIRLFYHYGLTLQEVFRLSMIHIKFEHNEIIVEHENNESRMIKLEEQDKRIAYSYFIKIHEPVRPRYYSMEPFFVAFDFKRKTFHWSYDDDMPKRMTMIAIQKMLRMEVKRARLRKGISAQTLRHTFILSRLVSGTAPEKLIELIGYTSPLSIKRYVNTVALMSPEQINAFI